MSTPYALSTVALSAYNLLTIGGQPMAPEEIHHRLETQQHPGLSADQLLKALAELERRGLVRSDGDKYRGIDPKRRTVAYRDRSDGWAVDPKTGEPTGGWSGWMVRDRRRGLIPISEVARAAQRREMN